MPNVLRVKAQWTGFTGSPGYSVFHFRDFDSDTPTDAQATAAMARVREWCANVSQFVPAVVSLQVQSDVDVIEDTTGQLVTVLSGTPVLAVTGGASASAGFATAVGAVITWRTGTVRNGRRVRGRTFIVPLSSAAFETNGTLSSAALTAFNTAATNLRNPTGTPDLGVYARPSGPAATDGSWAVVTGHSVPDMGAVLRSRRN
jgi:hypothetical protein